MGIGDHRRELSVLQEYGRQPSYSSSNGSGRETEPTTPNVISARLNGPPNLNSSVFFDFEDSHYQLSPHQRPPTSGTAPSITGPNGDSYFADDRRPSVASVVTNASSTGSKSSLGRSFFNRLLGAGDESPGSSDTSLHHHHNGHSSQNLARPTTPTASRPRTPLPPAEVVPFEYQDPDDIRHYGYAPVRATPVTNSSYARYLSEEAPPPTASSHKARFGRHHKEKENRDKELPARPQPTAKDSSTSIATTYSLRDGASTSTAALISGRSGSPTPSVGSAFSLGGGPQSPTHNGMVHSKKGGKLAKLFRSGGKEKDRTRNGSADSVHSLKRAPNISAPLQTSPGFGAIAARRGQTSSSGSTEHNYAFSFNIGRKYSDNPSLRNGKMRRKDSDQSALSGRGDGATDMPGVYYSLDTNLNDLKDIVKPIAQAASNIGDAEGWNAPDSWNVTTKEKKEQQYESRMEELDDDKPIWSVMYRIRIFRKDSTFATLGCSLHSSVSEVVANLGRKSFLQGDLSNYQIVLRKQGLLKVLGDGDRPLLIQKRLLEQAGYTEHDHLEDIGREDHSYLCRFIFQPATVGGYALEPDTSLANLKKFNYVDLSAKNLLTIPIIFYRKATDIISLNLSRNLSLDIPLDFIQACISLRKIEFKGNEVYKLPASISHASRLTYLDVSNNRLEELDHASLDKHPLLVSLNVSNNRLTTLPNSFAAFKSLRTLNVAANILDTFPLCLCDLVTLKDIDISFNRIQTIPPQIGKLVQLERFMATNNRLSGSFPAAFGSLINLKELDVRYNEIKDLDVLTELPKLELLLAGHNKVTTLERAFPKIRALHLNHNPLNVFALNQQMPTLTVLNLSNGSMTSFDEGLCDKLPNLHKLSLDCNGIMSFPAGLGKLKHLEHLSCYSNSLTRIPQEIGQLTELKVLDLHDNALKSLPSEIWHLTALQILNISSNKLTKFPRFIVNPAQTPVTNSDSSSLVSPSNQSSRTDLTLVESHSSRRPSGPGNLLNVGNSPGSSGRQGSLVSIYGQGGRVASVIPNGERSGTITPSIRKESTTSTRMQNTIATSLRRLYVADNHLEDSAFLEIAHLGELRTLNMSYNNIYDIPARTLSRLTQLNELYLSGNELTSLPAEDLESIANLQSLYLNGNKFQTLPAELGKVRKLVVLDVGSNSLKYNINNWPYDWNWNWNLELKYLNLSGNKRLEIKTDHSNIRQNVREKSFADFSQLSKLRVLGLMDVTLTIPTVPDENEDRRVRTSGSVVRQNMLYGMADSLGKGEHLSLVDMVVPEFRGNKDECLLGLFDGEAMSSGGSKVAKHLQENFSSHFQEELDKLRKEESTVTALRRTFLSLNKDLANTAMSSKDEKVGAAQGSLRGSTSSNVGVLGEDDLAVGASACVVYIAGSSMFVANVGDVMAVLIRTNSEQKVLTRKHEPGFGSELERIRDAGGYVTREGGLKLCGRVPVSRAFGYFDLMPAIQAAPHIHEVHLSDQDDLLVVASKELWEHIDYDAAVDIIRLGSTSGDLMRAANRLRDFAISYGATEKLMVMVVGIGNNRKKIRQDSIAYPQRPGRPPLDLGDTRIPKQIDAPEGELAICFTDIKNSTILWDKFAPAMRTAIQTHNQIMRRQLQIHGGYEVKTEGDAFMVCFRTPTSALLWCFSVQQLLLQAPWPSQILESEHGKEITDEEGRIIYRGVSVRMGIHWGAPVCEVDPITSRMDYFGPMVNKASRISSEADGGQITISSDFLAEIRKCCDAYANDDFDSFFTDDKIVAAVRKDMSSLSATGFKVEDMGMRKLKGIENKENVYLMLPHGLAGRLTYQKNMKRKTSTVNVEPDQIWALYELSLRLETLCHGFSSDVPGVAVQLAPHNETESMVLKMKHAVLEQFNDKDLAQFFQKTVTSIENSMVSLTLRRMLLPADAALDATGPSMNDILDLLQAKIGGSVL
ncbi:PP2C-domain-containing protein [Ascobolus immersus RN42]|uniref:Adenylate cyclase n=1 Tax=Ascobolus immersus RN42 TaxID=1160509 RepID=A0A3N4IMQ6_ASCIM|nr:PP2C-domain-containing protein [Ascobolus immersus RN42]